MKDKLLVGLAMLLFLSGIGNLFLYVEAEARAAQVNQLRTLLENGEVR